MQLIDNLKKSQSGSAILLLSAAIIALIWANSPLAFLHSYFTNTFLFIINEGLMSLFFLMVGLELKRGFLEGELGNLKQVMLPAFAALGGMLIPALIYILINVNHPQTLRAWPTPVATDIAFAVGVLSLFGKRVPNGLKLFLLMLAIFDDIGAIIIITVFYSAHISYALVTVALGLSCVLWGLNTYNIKKLPPYLITGLMLWCALLYSGIHPTLGGVVLALFIPDNFPRKRSPLHRLEFAIRPSVSFIILPIFALANAGFAINNLGLNTLTSTVVSGIVVGLFLGKQLGVVGFSWALIKLGMAKLPPNTSWQAFYGVAVLCGIGFTMSLFLGTLSFENESIYLSDIRFGVIVGSLLSGVTGAFLLRQAFSLIQTNSQIRGDSVIANK